MKKYRTGYRGNQSNRWKLTEFQIIMLKMEQMELHLKARDVEMEIFAEKVTNRKKDCKSEGNVGVE